MVDEEKLGRREKERLTRRQEILAAAREVFLECGYEGATLDDVAHRAEFAKGTLYSYFSSKAELFESLVDSEFGRVINDVAAAMAAEPDDELALRAAVRVGMRNMALHESFFRVAGAVHGGGAREDEFRIRKVVLERFGELATVVSQRVATAITAGVFRPLDPKLVAFILLGTTFYCAVYRARTTQATLGDEEADLLWHLFLNGIRRQPVGPAEE
jgi:AcrR family transcriptional regulator